MQLYLKTEKKGLVPLNVEKEAILGEGLSAVVCKAGTVDGNWPNLVIKIYKKEVPYREREIVSQIRESNLGKSDLICPCLCEVVESNEKTIGFAMNRMSGYISIKKLYEENLDILYDFSFTVPFAIQLCQVLSEIHESGFIVGDLSDENILVNLSTRKIVLIDTDSFGTENLPPKSVTPNFNSPDSSLTRPSDLFSLGIHLVHLLYGVHPFLGQKENSESASIDDNLKNGYSWLWDTGCHLPRGYDLQEIPQNIKAQLLRLLSPKPYEREIDLKCLEEDLIEFQNNDYKSIEKNNQMDFLKKNDSKTSIKNKNNFLDISFTGLIVNLSVLASLWNIRYLIAGISPLSWFEWFILVCFILLFPAVLSDFFKNRVLESLLPLVGIPLIVFSMFIYNLVPVIINSTLITFGNEPVLTVYKYIGNDQIEIKYLNGDIYRGEYQFVDGDIVLNGRGNMQYSSGDSFIGQFSSDKEIEGLYRFYEGGTYEGNVENGFNDDFATFTNTEGVKFEGKVVDAQFSGLVKVTYPDGRTEELIYKE